MPTRSLMRRLSSASGTRRRRCCAKALLAVQRSSPAACRSGEAAIQPLGDNPGRLGAARGFKQGVKRDWPEVPLTPLSAGQ